MADEINRDPAQPPRTKPLGESSGTNYPGVATDTAKVDAPIASRDPDLAADPRDRADAAAPGAKELAQTIADAGDPAAAGPLGGYGVAGTPEEGEDGRR